MNKYYLALIMLISTVSFAMDMEEFIEQDYDVEYSAEEYIDKKVVELAANKHLFKNSQKDDAAWRFAVQTFNLHLGYPRKIAMKYAFVHLSNDDIVFFKTHIQIRYTREERLIALAKRHEPYHLLTPKEWHDVVRKFNRMHGLPYLLDFRTALKSLRSKQEIGFFKQHIKYAEQKFSPDELVGRLVKCKYPFDYISDHNGNFDKSLWKYTVSRFNQDYGFPWVSATFSAQEFLFPKMQKFFNTNLHSNKTLLNYHQERLACYPVAADGRVIKEVTGTHLQIWEAQKAKLDQL